MMLSSVQTKACRHALSSMVRSFFALRSCMRALCEEKIGNGLNLNEDVASAKITTCQIVETEQRLTSRGRRMLLLMKVGQRMINAMMGK